MKKFIALSVTLALFIAGCELLGGHDEPALPGKIVFSAKVDENGTSQIFTMNADGTGLRQLTFWDRGSVEPAWSPDGQRIAFATGYRATTLGSSLYIMDADGGNKRPLKKFPDAVPNVLYGSNPAWSPDGEKIAFNFCTNCEGGGSNYQIAVVDVEGVQYDSTQMQILTSYRGSDTYPTWSPDGRSIAFVSDRDYVNADTLRFRRDLYLFSADGTNLKRITHTGFAGTPVWHSNSNAIIFRSGNRDKDLALFRVSLKTEQISRIETNLADDKQLFQLFPQAWPADGRFLLATGRDISRPHEFFLYIVNTLKKETKQLSIASTRINGADWHIDTNKN